MEHLYVIIRFTPIIR